MQEKDIISNRYLAVNERFAQICNNTLFDGRPLILPEKLVSLDRTEAYIPSDKAKTGRRGRPQASQLYRDILKLYDNRLLILMPGRFYQGENSRPGSGIGLSYSKILAEQQGGSVGALNNVESAGSTFWFELPLNIKPGKLILQPQPYLNELLASAENIESVPDEPTFRSETKDYTILVVDDNMELVDYLNDAMRPYFKTCAQLGAVYGSQRDSF